MTGWKAGGAETGRKRDVRRRFVPRSETLVRCDGGQLDRREIAATIEKKWEAGQPAAVVGIFPGCGARDGADLENRWFTGSAMGDTQMVRMPSKSKVVPPPVKSRKIHAPLSSHRPAAGEETSPRHFLAYWTPRTVDRQLEDNDNLRHSASNQFRHVRPGDTVWIVTVRQGTLRFVTRIVVERITSQAGAAEELGCWRDDLWDATHHIIAEVGTELPIYDCDIHHLAATLRFKSKAGKDRLILGPDGEVNAQQLQTMRWLWPEAAELLAREIGITV